MLRYLFISADVLRIMNFVSKSRISVAADVMCSFNLACADRKPDMLIIFSGKCHYFKNAFIPRKDQLYFMNSNISCEDTIGIKSITAFVILIRSVILHLFCVYM